MNAVVPMQQAGIYEEMASRYGMNREAFERTLMATVMPKEGATREQTAAFLLVAKQHGLNPFTKEVFAFPSRGGGIQPVVSVDGWMKLMNQHPEFDGLDFEDRLDANGALVSVTCIVHRKDRGHPIRVTEYMSECRRDTDTWKRWPARMLRHKAAIQAARYAFGFAGIMEPDEVERMDEVAVTQVPPANLITDERKARCDEAAEQYAASVAAIKEAIAKEDYYSAMEAWDEVPQAAQQDLWLAPTKGGVFTTVERKALQTLLPRGQTKPTEPA